MALHWQIQTRYQEEIIYCESREMLEQVVQQGCGCPYPGGIQGQAGWGFEHLGVVRGVPADSSWIQIGAG